jgi:predicted porin
MKKTLIALAAVAVSGAAFAQSNVSISGTFDPSYSRVKAGTAATATTLADSQQGTSGINFRGTEDLGGGLKAYFRYEANFDSTSGGDTDATRGLVRAGEVFVGLQGGFGSVQIGRPNSHTLAAQTARHAFGTKVGGGFTGATGTSNVRNADSIKYTSPTFSGFTVGGTHQLKSAAPGGVNAWNEIGVFYANGPLRVSFTNVAQKDTIAQNNIAVSYNLGVATVFVGYHNQDNKQNLANSKNKGQNIAVSAPMGAITLMANMGKLNVNGGNAGDRDLTAVGARYDLSKRTNVYARYVSEKTKGATSATDSTTKTTLVGLQHNF